MQTNEQKTTIGKTWRWAFVPFALALAVTTGCGSSVGLQGDSGKAGSTQNSDDASVAPADAAGGDGIDANGSGAGAGDTVNGKLPQNAVDAEIARRDDIPAGDVDSANGKDEPVDCALPQAGSGAKGGWGSSGSVQTMSQVLECSLPADTKQAIVSCYVLGSDVDCKIFEAAKSDGKTEGIGNNNASLGACQAAAEDANKAKADDDEGETKCFIAFPKKADKTEG
jgi:hypothetical protein